MSELARTAPASVEEGARPAQGRPTIICVSAQIQMLVGMVDGSSSGGGGSAFPYDWRVLW